MKHDRSGDSVAQQSNEGAGEPTSIEAGSDSMSEAVFLREIARIRAFELRLLELFAEGRLFGTTHTCIGQEACAVALYASVDPARDAAFSNHRCHGHYLAFGGSMTALMAEIMGREMGVCSGRGGSQHLCEGSFFSQGVQAGSAPIGAGYARWLQRQGRGGLVVVHIGDGTLGAGVLYESLNLIALYQLPVLVVVEHNGVAQSTDTARTTAGSVEARFSAFGLEVDRRDAGDPVALGEHLRNVTGCVRAGKPFVQILDTFRLMAHSKGDDDRDPSLVADAWKKDWLATRLEAGNAEALRAMEDARAEVLEVSEAVEIAHWAELLSPGALQLMEDCVAESSQLAYTAPDDGAGKRISELLNAALHDILSENPQAIMVGEDLLDPYGGAFKVARGLSTRFPDQVISTPISEAAIVGFGIGWSLAGGRAIVEIMFSDFATLAADQIINQAAKMHFMYSAKVSVPITIRLVSGGYRGYGPTHSQCMESLFCGVAGLRVVALSRRHDPAALLRAVVVDDPNPVVFVENKMLYAARPLAGVPSGGFTAVSITASPDRPYPPLSYATVRPDRPADVTVVTYGGMTDMVEGALEDLILEREVEVDYFVLSQISPVDIPEIIESCARTGRLVTIEEGPERFGVGSEVIAVVTQALPGRKLAARRVGALDLPIPNSRRQEEAVLPSRDRIAAAIRDVIEEAR
jgi:2-oxoisovalerate dehydrogenase E1 component